MSQSFDLKELAGIGVVYLVAILLTLLAYLAARLAKRWNAAGLSPQLLPPLAVIYSLTLAFLLSYAVFQVASVRTEITKEVATIYKLGSIVEVLPSESRVEARRLIYDYAYSIATSEAISIRTGQRSKKTQLALQRLRDFFGSGHATLDASLDRTPEQHGYSTLVIDFLFDMIDAREKRLAFTKLRFPEPLWAAFAVMFLVVGFVVFVLNQDRRNTIVAGLLLLLVFPVPSVLLYLYSHPFASGLIDIGQTFSQLLDRSI